MSDGMFLRADRTGTHPTLEESERRRELALEAAEIGTWDYDLVRGVWRFDARARQLYNLRSDRLDGGPEGLAANVHPDDKGSILDAIKRATAVAGDGRHTLDYRIAQDDGSYRWLRAWGKTEFEGNGSARRAVRIVGASRDVTVEKNAEDALRVLVGERQHRVRNILTVIRSIFSRTVEHQTSMEDVVEHFRGRLDALARTQVVLTQRASGVVDLEQLIRDELLSVGASPNGNLAIEGPQVDLTPKQAESIGLAIHELTTNSIKYGALSVDGAKLRILWDIANKGRQSLRLQWIEHGVLIASDPNRRKGFGHQLIEDGLPYRLGGSARLDLKDRGVDCEIVIPLFADTSEQTGFEDS